MVGSKEMYMDMQQELAATITDYENGNIGVLDALTSLRTKRVWLEDGLSIIKDFESGAISEIAESAKEYQGKYNGFTIEVRQGRKTYDFSKIDEIKIAKANVKELEDYYKKAFEAKQKNILTASEDGEEIQLPELKYGKSYAIVNK